MGAMSERKDRFLSGLLAVVFTFWAGGEWTVGYLVAPTLFAHLDRITAGAVAGVLFHWIAWLGLVVGLLLALVNRARGQWGWRTWSLLAVAGLAWVSLFWLQPLMADLKAMGLDDPETAARFGQLHGISAGLYLVQSLLALALVWGGPLKAVQNSNGVLSEGR